MVRSLPVAFLECALLAVPLLGAQSGHPNDPNAAVETVSSSGGMLALPPVPDGTTTIVGGTIQNLDLVRDQFSLALYGQRPMKILFDERTQVYRDGVKIPLRDLRPEVHASVQTALDGSNVFAVSIHILSISPEGECRGRVLRFNARTGELEVRTALSPEPVKTVRASGRGHRARRSVSLYCQVFGAKRSCRRARSSRPRSGLAKIAGMWPTKLQFWPSPARRSCLPGPSPTSTFLWDYWTWSIPRMEKATKSIFLPRASLRAENSISTKASP